MRETTHEGMCEISCQNRQLLILSLVYFDKFHTFPYELFPSCNSTKMCDHFTIELNIYTALWNRMVLWPASTCGRLPSIISQIARFACNRGLRPHPHPLASRMNIFWTAPPTNQSTHNSNIIYR